MDITEDLPAARVRDCRAKPMRPPWTYRCYRFRGEAVIDADAFTLDEAVALAASHWNVEADQKACEASAQQTDAVEKSRDGGTWPGRLQPLRFAGAIPAQSTFR